MHKDKLVVVTDSYHCRFLHYAKQNHLTQDLFLNDINSKEILQNKVRDKGKHPPEGASHSHHYHDPHTPWRDVEKINFSQAIIDVLEKNIERLSEVVLIAPPEFLGLLRKKLQKTLKGIKKHFIEKNLVKQRPENILPYLSPLVAHKKESSG